MSTNKNCLIAEVVQNAGSQATPPQWYLVLEQDDAPEDAEANLQALIDGCRVLSSYELGDGERLWIITEADRSATTLLLPDEY